jgi:hypothetical protein
VEYEVRPTRVGPRSRRPVVAGTVGLLAFVVAAIVIATAWPAPSTGRADLVAGQPPTPGPSGSAPLGLDAPTSGPISEDLELGSIGDVDRRLVRCNGMDNPACLLLARVAVTVVMGNLDRAAGAVIRVDVSRSLLCNSDADCPRDVLSRTNPFGSAIVEVAGTSTAAWINVTRVLAPGGPTHAWIIRWARVARISLGSIGPRARLIGR